MLLRAVHASVALLALLALAACGRTVSFTGTADEAWTETIDTLRIQGVMPDAVPEGLARPRIDRTAGEIDLVHAENVYYGQGAAFIQVDVEEPHERRPRTVRLWIDYPVGNRVVRYGRALHERETDSFARDFERAHRALLARRTTDAAPAGPTVAPTAPPETTP